MQAVVLAGGKGTRLQPRINDVPKPLAPVLGRPFLEHLLNYWIDQGVTRFVLSVGYLSSKISDHFGNFYRGAEIGYSNETEPLGTGGGLFRALEMLQSQSPAVLLNGDSFFELRLEEMLRFHQRKGSHWTLALRRIEKNTRYGSVETDTEGRCVRMGPPPADLAAEGPAEINGGVYLFEPAFLKAWAPRFGGLPVSLESQVIPQWIENGEKIFGFKTTGRFIDIGIPEDYEKAEAFFR